MRSAASAGGFTAPILRPTPGARHLTLATVRDVLGAAPSFCHHGFRAFARRRFTATPAPMPAAARPAAIRPGWARSRENSSETFGHSSSSRSSAAASGVAGTSSTGTGSPNATRTVRGRGSGPAKSFSVPVIAAGMSGAPVSSARRTAPRFGVPSSSGSRTRVPSGKSDSSSPCSRMIRAVSSASASDWPRSTGNAPSLTRSFPLRPSKSSDLPMKRSGRFVAAARKNESKKLLWLGVMIAAPSSGTCSSPSIRRPHQMRMNGTATVLHHPVADGRDALLARHPLRLVVVHAATAPSSAIVRSTGLRPSASARRSRSARRECVHVLLAAELAADRGHPHVVDRARDDPLERLEVVVHVHGEPVRRDPAAHVDADRADLPRLAARQTARADRRALRADLARLDRRLARRPHAGEAFEDLGGDAEVAERSDHRPLERPDVGVDVAVHRRRGRRSDRPRAARGRGT